MMSCVQVYVQVFENKLPVVNGASAELSQTTKSLPSQDKLPLSQVISSKDGIEKLVTLTLSGTVFLSMNACMRPDHPVNATHNYTGVCRNDLPRLA